jgi:hypothetical protein
MMDIYTSFGPACLGQPFLFSSTTLEGDEHIHHYLLSAGTFSYDEHTKLLEG